MDGNGRWAKARGLPRAAGHRAGAEAARAVLRAAGEAGVECLTLYAFSSENWRRPAQEISDLTGLLRFYHPARARQPSQGRDPPQDPRRSQGLRGRRRGDGRQGGGADRGQSPDDARDRPQLRRAAPRSCAPRGRAAAAGEIDEAAIERALDTHDLPPLDLLIRTSGEHRLSQFPALAGGLCRIAVRRHALARFRRRRAARGARRLCPPRAPLRRPMTRPADPLRRRPGDDRGRARRRLFRRLVVPRPGRRRGGGDDGRMGATCTACRGSGPDVGGRRDGGGAARASPNISIRPACELLEFDGGDLAANWLGFAAFAGLAPAASARRAAASHGLGLPLYRAAELRAC